MAAEYPPLGKSFVLSYSNNDRDFPIVAIRKDPRVDNYRIPEDLSPHPDSKRWPNHVFTGAQPTNSDERVQWIYEILPSPWVPFTRYDDDLGPVQGRRRSVKNEGQVADLTADKRTTYEAREGSAIVYTELEESWSIKTDEDGNSLFPIRDRDFYDPSRGPVQERRQLFVPTGEEEGSLENVNGVITQTSYEPYNEFLSVKIVQTYKVNGPQLIGNATDNEGQLVTITTQRKAADGYVPTSPTATRTVEVSREDAESLIERIVDTPQVFGAEIYRKTKEDLTPQKFRAAQEDSTVEQNIEGAASPTITLATGEFAKSEQQINKFVKRVSTTSRSTTVNPDPLIESVLTNEGQLGTRTLTLASGPQTITPSATMVDANVEALGDGRTVKTEVVVPNVFSGKTVQKSRIDLTPEKFKAAQEDTTTEESVAGTVNPNVSLGAGEFRKSEQQVTEFVKRISATSRDISAATSLTETVITQQGQIATRTLSLSAQPQSIQPDALLVDGSIEALGDGRTIKTETRVPAVFPATTISTEKPDNIPLKFRVAIPSVTTETTIAGTVEAPILEGNELAKSEQQITEFIKKKSVTTRQITSRELTGSVYTTELGGGMAVVTETFPASMPLTSVPEFGVVSDEIENIGDQRRVRRQVKLTPKTTDLGEFTDDGERINVQSLAVLRGQEYDQELDIVIPYSQVVVNATQSSSIIKSRRNRIDPKDPTHSLVFRFDLDDIQDSLDDYYWEIPDMINVSLPDKLLSVALSSDSSSAETQSFATGDTYSISISEKSSVGGTLSYNIQQGFQGVVPTIRAIFFLPKGGASPQDVLARINSEKGENVEFWPNARPTAHQIAIIEKSNFSESSESVSFDSNSTSTTNGGSISTQIVNIPPTIHGSISIGSSSSAAGRVRVSPSTLGATNFTTFPTGLFLYQINATPYRFSYVRVDALLVQITNEYV